MMDSSNLTWRSDKKRKHESGSSDEDGNGSELEVIPSTSGSGSSTNKQEDAGSSSDTDNASTSNLQLLPHGLSDQKLLITDSDGLDEIGLINGNKAMQINMILDKIVIHLPGEELETLRETCALWSSCFGSHLIELEQNRFYKITAELPGEKIEESSSSEDPVEGEKLELFKELRSTNSPMTVYNKYELQDIFAATDEQFKTFFTENGPSLKSLYIRPGSQYLIDSDLIPGVRARKSVEVDLEKLRRIIFELTPLLDDLTLTIGDHFKETAELPKEGNIRNIKKQMPNLRQLTIIPHVYARGSGSEVHPVYADLLADILANAPNLHTLILGDSRSVTRNLLFTMFNCLKHVGPLKTLRIEHHCLQSLKLVALQQLIGLAEGRSGPRPPGSQHLLQLEEFVGPLLALDKLAEEEEEVSPGQFGSMKPAWLRFYTTQSSSLKNLTLQVYDFENRADNELASTLQLPRMPELKTFHFGITSRHRPRFPIHLEGSTFQSNFPKLTRFEYFYHKDHPTTFYKAHMERYPSYAHLRCCLPHHGLKELCLHFCKTPFFRMYRSLTNFPVAFPSITRLQLEFGCHERDVMDRLFLLSSHWSSTLAELHLKFLEDNPYMVLLNSRDRLDRMLAGVSIAKFKGLEAELKLLKEEHAQEKNKIWEAIPRLIKKYKTRNGISDLPNLQKFVLDDLDADTFRLTDVGGYLGIATSTNIQHFEINRRPLRSKPSPAAEIADKDQDTQPSPQAEEEYGNLISPECQEYIKSSLSPYVFLKF